MNCTLVHLIYNDRESGKAPLTQYNGVILALQKACYIRGDNVFTLQLNSQNQT